MELIFKRHLNYRHWDERYSAPSASPSSCFSTGWSTDWPNIQLVPLTRICPALLVGRTIQHGSTLDLRALDAVLVFQVSLSGLDTSATYLVDTASSVRGLVISRPEEQFQKAADGSSTSSNDSLTPTPSAHSLIARLVPLCMEAFSLTPSPISYRSLLLSGPMGSGKTYLLDSLARRVAIEAGAETSSDGAAGRALLVLRISDVRRAPSSSSSAGVSILNAAGWSAASSRWSEVGVGQEVAGLLSALALYCDARQAAALAKLVLSAAAGRRARVLVVADDLDEVLGARVGADDGEGASEGPGSGPAGRLAWVLRRLSSVASSQASSSVTGLQVMMIGSTSLLPQSIPPASTGAPHFEKVVRVRAPTLEDRLVVLRDLLRGIGLLLGPGTGQDMRQGSEEICEQWAQSLAHLTAGHVPGDLTALALRIRCIHMGSAVTGASHPSEVPIPWSVALQAVALATPAHMRELAGYVGSLGGSVGSVGGGGAEGPGGGGGPSWSDFVCDEAVIRGLQRILRRGGVHGTPGEGQSAATTAYLATRTPRGIVLHGPPACGKTFLARIIACESGRHFISVRAPDLLSQYFGQTEAHVRGIFARARATGSCVLLFDEFEVLACRRGQDGGGTGLQGRVLSTFLNELDGVCSGGAAGGGGHGDLGDGGEEGGGGGDILVVVACNDLSLLDEALLRPGRLQHHVYLGPPSEADIGTMLRLRIDALRARGTRCDVDLTAVLAHFLPCHPRGADVDALLRAAVFAAVREVAQGAEEVCSAESLELLTKHFLISLPAPPPIIAPFVFDSAAGPVFSAGAH